MPPDIEKKSSYYVSALDKGVRLIEFLAGSPVPLGLSEISRRLEINKHMVLRLLRTFLERGWVAEVEEGPKYQLTLLPFHHLSGPIARNPLVDLATRPARQLCGDAAESVSFGVLDDDRILFLLHFEGRRRVVNSGRLGGRYYLHAAAPGKMLLAHAPESLLDRLVEEGLLALAPNTITSKGRLLEELAEVRQCGYALDDEEYARGLMCFAGPVYDHQGQIVAALNVSVLNVLYTKEKMIEEIGGKVLATCREISARMGHVDPRTVHTVARHDSTLREK